MIRDIEPWDELLQTGRDDERLVTQSSVHPRHGNRAPIPEELHPTVTQAVQQKGIDSLWSHQAEAIHAAWAGPTIVTTGTASGKSLCFQLPTLDVLCRDARARALYLYPTKALAQDQARALNAFNVKNARLAIYDGDTPREQRSAIRRNSNVVLTNPDMLHLGILPNHPAWGNFLSNLAIVVVDEAHVYRGVFGSHVANVLRRLRRIAAAYGTAPRFVMTSATIGNPGELAERLSGLDDFTVIDKDGSPVTKRTIAMWNPPVTDEKLGTRRSVLAEAADLLAELVSNQARTIVFMKSRKAVELMAKFTQLALEDLGHADLAKRVAPYRAGYTPQQRRELERKLVDGELLGVVSTDALELGIDIGSLDAAICVTFPGTVASLRQQWGRAGRRGRGLAVYVAGDDALDQFFCRHPDEFLDRPVENAILDHENEQIHAQHVLCAAHEGPLEPADEEYLGAVLEDDRRAAREHRPTQTATRRPVRPTPPRGLPRRQRLAALGQPRRLRDRRHGLGRADRHGRRPARDEHHARGCGLPPRRPPVRGRRARPRAAPRARAPVPGRLVHAAQARDRHLHRGAARPPRVHGRDALLRHRHRHRAGARLPAQAPRRPRGDRPDRPRPPADLVHHPGAVVRAPPELLRDDFPLHALLGALHAAEHSQIAVLPLLAMCDRWDIGGLSTNLHPQTGGPTIFIYDGHPGGIGITRRGFLAFDALVDDAHRLISECPCESGCPSCVQSPKCGNLNEPLSKHGAAEVMGRMLAAA